MSYRNRDSSRTTRYNPVTGRAWPRLLFANPLGGKRIVCSTEFPDAVDVRRSHRVYLKRRLRSHLGLRCLRMSS
jgi:hypothetical protein